MSIKIINADPKLLPPKLEKPVVEKTLTADSGDIEDALTREIVRATGKAPCRGCGR